MPATREIVSDEVGLQVDSIFVMIPKTTGGKLGNTFLSDSFIPCSKSNY